MKGFQGALVGCELVMCAFCMVAGETPPDAGPFLRSRVARLRSHDSIILPKGEYHFYPDSSPKMNFFVSNHDQQKDIPVGLPLVGKKDVVLDGQGSTFIFHGKMQPVYVQGGEGITLRHLTIRYAAPFLTEGKIVDTDGGKTTLQFAPENRYKVDDGKIKVFCGEEEQTVRLANAFEPEGPMVPRRGDGDLLWNYRAEQVAPDKVRFDVDAVGLGLKEGQVLVLRSGARPHPAVMLDRVRNATLEDVVISDSQGMGLLAQRSENISFIGGGCVRVPGRSGTTSADATHFSNCCGEIVVRRALFEGMMDDAINVHSTCLLIEKVESPTCLVAKYMHPQAIGFELFAPGESLQFIRPSTLENLPPETQRTVSKVETIDPTHVRLTLEKALPDGVGEGYAIENSQWVANVTFADNIVRHNRARGALFTVTSGDVRVQGNRFERVHGSAILLAGDASEWYETGACRRVSIVNNVFDHNLTADYQFTEAVISICPSVPDMARQKVPYHGTVVIEDNTFLTHHVPLLFLRSASGVSFTHNNLKWDDAFPPRREPEKPFIIDGPAPQNLQLPDYNN